MRVGLGTARCWMRPRRIPGTWFRCVAPSLTRRLSVRNICPSSADRFIGRSMPC